MLKQDNPLSATLVALMDQVRSKGKGSGLDRSEHLEGKSVLITGANSGLGKACAIELARRGARVLMACRSGIPTAGEDVKRASGSTTVEMLRLDLSDFVSVQAFCDGVRDRGYRFDVVILNAGVMPAKAERTGDGFELMFQVNFLSNVLLVRRLLRDGVIPNRVFSVGNQKNMGATPRIIIVSSESHRTAKPLDFDKLGDYVEYGLSSGMAQYGHTKLALCTLATELGRRLVNDDGTTDVSVHSLCPGPVNSGMARHAPVWVKPVLNPVMRLFFNSPDVASRPVVYLACSHESDGKSGTYMHMMNERSPREEALDAAAGAALWSRSEALLQRSGQLNAPPVAMTQAEAE
jgi:NAD(P)-dependent dehydrogenase (short-subunit alcohol dehydrogenase family)